MTLDDWVMSRDLTPDRRQRAIRGVSRQSHFLVVVEGDATTGASAGIRAATNTHWLKRADGFSCEAAAEAWGRMALDALDREGEQ